MWQPSLSDRHNLLPWDMERLTAEEWSAIVEFEEERAKAQGGR